MIQVLAIATGGAIGTLMRFYIATGIDQWLGRHFPYGTLFVNIVGSLFIGVLFTLLQERLAINPYYKLALTAGLLGGFTTFSAFSIQTIALLEKGELLKALANIILSLVLCLLAAWFGMILGRQISF